MKFALPRVTACFAWSVPGQTCASLGRLLGPLFGAPLFAWSEGNGLPWPLNYCLTWYLLCVLMLSTAQMSSFLPRSIERQKREPR